MTLQVMLMPGVPTNMVQRKYQFYALSRKNDSVIGSVLFFKYIN